MNESSPTKKIRISKNDKMEIDENKEQIHEDREREGQEGEEEGKSDMKLRTSYQEVER